jgi:hypothetical protein
LAASGQDSRRSYCCSKAASAAAAEAESSKTLTEQSQAKAEKIVQELDDERKNKVWRTSPGLRDGQDFVVALIGNNTFARLEGYTSENQYCQPFILYVTRANNQTPRIVSVDSNNIIQAGPPWNPVAVAANVSWRASNQGELILTAGKKDVDTPPIYLYVMHPEIYQGSVNQP